MTKLLLAGGTVADGSGASPTQADVLISGDRIELIAPGLGDTLGSNDLETRYVPGYVVSPGFIDIHTHSDLTVLANPSAPSKIHQGVTTEIVGNCGLGVAPIRPNTDLNSLRSAVSYLNLDPAVRWDWMDTAEYLEAVRQARPSLNVGTLTAHIPLRAAVGGFSARAMGRSELNEMRALLRDSFDQGSYGVSTGLVYPPACFADDDELLALGAEAATANRMFAWHVRDYGDDLLPSVQQALRVARVTGCHTQISHVAAVGRRNWGRVARVLEDVDTARSAGLDVRIDAYPYLAGNAPMAQLLPDWVQAGTSAETQDQLREPKVRRQIREQWSNRAVGWEEVTVSLVPPDVATDISAGQTIAQIAADRGCDGSDVVLDILAEMGSAVMMIVGGRSPDDMLAALRHPACVVASDGLSLDPMGRTGRGAPHPRCYGCFPRFLTEVAGSSGLRLGDAIRRCTAGPADAIGLTERGRLVAGLAADVVVFDPSRLADRATFSDPQLFPAGIELVVANGEVVVDAGRYTNARPGLALRSRS